MNSIFDRIGVQPVLVFETVLWQCLVYCLACFLWKRERRKIRIGGLGWSPNSFTAGWLITGGTGTGKTLSGVTLLLREVFRCHPNWGGLVIDDKGHFHQTVWEVACSFGREQDVIVLGPNESGRPVNRFNLTGDPRIPAETYASIIVDTAVAMGQRLEQSFFRTQSRDQITACLKALRLLNYEVTIENVYHMVSDLSVMSQTVRDLRKLSLPEADALAIHFEKRFLKQPEEQLGGVQGTIANYLSPYLVPEIVDLFQRDSTFNFDSLDNGKIICLALPQRNALSRRYLNTFLKQLFYYHVLGRFDSKGLRNLLILWADEAQHFVTDSEEGLSDYNTIDRIREANATVVMATQSIQSFIPPLGRDKAEVLRLNLRNRLIFQAATEADAVDAADFLGKHWRTKTNRAVGRGGRYVTWVEEEAHRVRPHVFRKLKNHQCIIVRADKRFRKRILSPLLPDGRICPWFRWWKSGS